jgi:hypothetical protein
MSKARASESESMPLATAIAAATASAPEPAVTAAPVPGAILRPANQNVLDQVGRRLRELWFDIQQRRLSGSIRIHIAASGGTVSGGDVRFEWLETFAR